MPKLGKLHVAVLFHEPGDAVAAAPAAGLTLDRQVGARKSESVCAWSLMSSCALFCGRAGAWGGGLFG
jgi:hypothetical protein